MFFLRLGVACMIIGLTANAQIERVWVNCSRSDFSHIAVCWETTEPEDSVVYYGSSKDCVNKVVGIGKTVRHVVELPLPDAGALFYRIQSGMHNTDVAKLPDFNADEIRIAVVGNLSSLRSLTAMQNDMPHLLVTAGDNVPRLWDLKIFGDAAEIRNHILSSFKKAMMEEDPAKRLALMIVVIGGGAPAELIRYVLVKDFREGVKESFRVLLCEAGERLLPEMPEDLAEEAARILKHKGVEIPFNSSIKDLTGEEIAAKNLFRQLSGKPQSAFEYKNPGTLATIGKNAAVA